MRLVYEGVGEECPKPIDATRGAKGAARR
jgi:hypothetical protein